MAGMLFIGDVLEFEEDVQLPVEIIKGYVLKRAVDKQVEIIKRKIGPGYIDFGDLHHERTKMDDGTFISLSPSQLNYWIIEYEAEHPYDRADDNLKIACILAGVSFNILIEILPGEGAYRQQYRIANFVQDNYIIMKPKTVALKDIREISRIYDDLKGFEINSDNYPEIKKAIFDFERLNVVPVRSPFYFVSIFSIIEGILTYDSKDKGASLTYQLQKKLNLLNNRFELPLESTHNLDCGFEKLITKLYTYRSKIAHGSESDFASGELAVLKNQENASKLIYTILQRLLIQAIREPQLISDLKRC